MKTRDIALLLGLLLIMAVAQLIAVQGGTAAVLCVAVLDGILLIAATRPFGVLTDSTYLSAFLSFAASLAGLVFATAYSPGFTWSFSWPAPFLAALPPAAWSLGRLLRAPRCRICKHPVRRLFAFSCPRCKLLACERCWEYEKCRCRLCESNRVLLLPQISAWWNENLGERVYTGKCSLCLNPASASESPLRACPSCHHTQCQLCWDDNNGQCSRCEWVIEGLPQVVKDHLAVGRNPKYKLSSAQG